MKNTKAQLCHLQHPHSLCTKRHILQILNRYTQCKHNVGIVRTVLLSLPTLGSQLQSALLYRQRLTCVIVMASTELLILLNLCKLLTPLTIVFRWLFRFVNKKDKEYFETKFNIFSQTSSNCLH